MWHSPYPSTLERFTVASLTGLLFPDLSDFFGTKQSSPKNAAADFPTRSSERSIQGRLRPRKNLALSSIAAICFSKVGESVHFSREEVWKIERSEKKALPLIIPLTTAGGGGGATHFSLSSTAPPLSRPRGNISQTGRKPPQKQYEGLCSQLHIAG